MKIIGPSLQRETECEQVPRSLPKWFGIEKALLMYARDSGKLPTFAVESETRIIGFLSLQEHFPSSWEVHCVAVAAKARSAGHGTRLLEHAEHWLRNRGVRFLQIKTVAAGSPSPEYAESREFYAARGYLPLEVFPTLWSPRNPALQLIKSLPAIATGESHAVGEFTLVQLRERNAVDDLPERMRQVARLAAEGHSNKHIAAQMNISPNTVRNHLAEAYERLAVRNKAEMAGLLLRFEQDFTGDKGG